MWAIGIVARLVTHCVYTVRLTFLKFFFIEMQVLFSLSTAPLRIFDVEEVDFHPPVGNQKFLFGLLDGLNFP
jgi:hypothetical protein